VAGENFTGLVPSASRVEPAESYGLDRVCREGKERKEDGIVKQNRTSRGVHDQD
jgi:hypothetical protein